MRRTPKITARVWTAAGAGALAIGLAASPPSPEAISSSEAHSDHSVSHQDPHSVPGRIELSSRTARIDQVKGKETMTIEFALQNPSSERSVAALALHLTDNQGRSVGKPKLDARALAVKPGQAHLRHFTTPEGLPDGYYRLEAQGAARSARGLEETVIEETFFRVADGHVEPLSVEAFSASANESEPVMDDNDPEMKR